jgi:PAS domain S-box-containing protein
MVKTRSKTVAPGSRAMQASGDGYWEMDLVDGSTWFSDWFYAILGWDRQSGPKAWAALRPVLHPEDWESLLRDIRQHLEERESLDCEVRVRLADGAAQWWQIRGAAQFDATRKPVFLAGIVRDVTATRSQHDHSFAELLALRRSVEELRELLHGKRGEMTLEYAAGPGAARHRLQLRSLPGGTAARLHLQVTHEESVRDERSVPTASEVT